MNPGVALHEVGTRLQTSAHVIGGRHPADGDDRQPVTHSMPQAYEHLGRPLGEDGAGQPACAGSADRRSRGQQPVGPGDRGVGGADAVEAELERKVCDGVDVVVGEVGGDLDQQRHAAAGIAFSHALDRGEQRTELGDRLQVAETGRVGRRHVDDEIARKRREQPGTLDVVGDGVLGLDHLGPADVDADDRGPASLLLTESVQPCRDHGGAFVVEAHSVDDCAVVDEAEEPWPGIARLRAGCDGADLDVPESEGQQPGNRARVLVETGGKAERVRELDAHDRAGYVGLADCQPRGETAGADRGEAPFVRLLGIHRGEGGVEEGAVDHGVSVSARGC